MRAIRASEISTYLFCHRAWWYQQRGETSENQAEMVEGREIHYRHRRKVMEAGCLRLVAYGLLLLGLVLITIYLTQISI